MIKTGFARLCITPPLGEPISGYYEARFTKGVLDHLYVTAVAFDDGKRKAVFLGTDLIMLTTEQCAGFRKTVADFCGIPVEGVFLFCSHTHTGPMIGKDFASDLHGSKEYEAFMVTQLRDAAKYAMEDLKETTVSIAKSEAKNVSYIRRFRMKDGSVRTNPGVGRDDILEPLGTPNETVSLVRLDREGGDDIFIVSFGVHPDCVGGELISADYPGFVRETLEKALDGVKCLFLTGLQGDVNHVNPQPTEGQKKGTIIDFDSVPRGHAHAKYMGRAIAGAVLQVCDKAEPVQADEIAYAGCTVTLLANAEHEKYDQALEIVRLHESGRDAELPYDEMELTTVVAEAIRIVELKDGPKSFDFDLSAFRLGDVAFAGFPGEPFVEIGRRVEKASPFAMTVNCCLTNGGDSYFPTSQAYDEGGYEARSSRLKKGSDETLIDSVVGLLKTLK